MDMNKRITKNSIIRICCSEPFLLFGILLIMMITNVHQT